MEPIIWPTRPTTNCKSFVYFSFLSPCFKPPLCHALQQKFPDEGLANVVRNVFDFDSYNKDVQDVLIEVLHKHGIPIGAKPSSVNLAKE